MNNETYTVAQACEILGASRNVVRKILKRGTIRGIKRQRNKYRVLDAEQLELLRTLYCLNRGGATIRDLKKYASLEYSGATTLPERKAILETKKRQMWEKLKELQTAIDFIERKVEIIDQTTNMGQWPRFA